MSVPALRSGCLIPVPPAAVRGVVDQVVEPEGAGEEHNGQDTGPYENRRHNRDASCPAGDRPPVAPTPDVPQANRPEEGPDHDPHPREDRREARHHGEERLTVTMVRNEGRAQGEQGDGGNPLHRSSHHHTPDSQPRQTYAILVRGLLRARLCSPILGTRHGRHATRAQDMTSWGLTACTALERRARVIILLKTARQEPHRCQDS